MDTNIICENVWLDSTDCSLGSGFTLFTSLTWNRCYTAGVTEDDLIYSGKYLSILPMYFIIDTLTDPLLD